MSEHLAIVRTLLEAGSRRDASVHELYAADVEWDVSRGPLVGLSGARVYCGHDGLRRFFQSWHDAWQDAEYALDELIEVEDVVVSVGRLRGRGRTSGIAGEAAEQSAVWTIRAGQVARVVWFATRAEALEAAGGGRRGLGAARGPSSGVL